MLIINSKEKLHYLIKEYLRGNYKTSTFCDLFSQVYDLEVDYRELSTRENELFTELSKMCGRFSDVEEDLKLPNVYFDEKVIKNKVNEVSKSLGIL